MQIKCPECEEKLNLKRPKPGKYGLRCKHCEKKFAMQVTDDDPPKVAVGRIRPKRPKASPQDSKRRQSEPAGNTETNRTAIEATIDAAATQSRGPSKTAVEATIDADAGETRVDASIDTDGKDAPRASSGPGEEPIVRSGAGSQKQVAKNGDEEIASIPDRLGGYRILRLLGRGAMGAVYEAKQVSLDRIVALKTIRGRLADNPASLARFTREAYAAAQLTHHNVVQIYDFGVDDGRHYFSMEWVRGGPLSDVVRDKGMLDPKLAAGYTLQAARGLQFAHQNGMVHRDVKPANLLLSDEGVVKVADLGLVKIPDQMDPESDVGVSSMSGLQSGTQVTMLGTAVGTPAYMAPEQGVDAATVDHRADVYSLGCSLFFMLAGKPPFDGDEVSKVLDQHAHEQTPDLTTVSSRIPSELNNVVQRAMAKRPADRYESLAQMIDDLESYLGVSKDGSFSPSAQQADEWESIAKNYQRATPLTRFSGPILLGFTLVCGLLTLVVPLISVWWLLLAPAMFCVAVTTPVVMSGNSSAVGMSFRRWISSLSWFDCVVGLLGAVVALIVSLAVGIWPGLLLGSILGVIIGGAYHVLVVAASRRNAATSIEQAERFIRDLRIDGADEDGVRAFAARYGGKTWQSLYESLFGYDSLCQIRQQLSSDPSFTGGSTREGLRDRVAAQFLTKAEANEQSRVQKRLAKIEERGLASEGVSPSEAREQAWAMAEAIVANAQAKTDATGGNDSLDAAVARQIKRERQKAMLADARSGKYARKRDPFAFIKFVLGGQTRLLFGCLLLAVFAIWAQGTGLFETIQQADGVTLETFQGDDKADLMGSSTSPWSIGLAGVLLCLSAFVSGWRMTPFAVVATVVILFGHVMGVPDLASLKSWMIAAVIGIAIYVPGVIWGESKDF